MPASGRSSFLPQRGTGIDHDGVAEEGTGQEEGGEEGDEAGEAQSGEGAGDSPAHRFDNKGVKSTCSFENMVSEGGMKACGRAKREARVGIVRLGKGGWEKESDG